jgi:hypothetical protein
VSDARTDFFASGAKTAPAKAAKSRDDFFAGNFDIEADTPEPVKKDEQPSSSFAQPYSYFTPEVQRLVAPERMESGVGQGAGRVISDLAEDPMAAIRAVPAGINRGVTDIAGLPMDTATAGANLLGMGYGTAASLATGKPAGEFFEPTDPGTVAGGSEWFSQKLDALTGALGGGAATQLEDPNNAAARLAYGAARGAPGSMTGRAAFAGAAGSEAATIAGELGADPATQAAASILGGHAGAAPGHVDAGHKSAGAAGAAVDLQKLSPDLRAAVEKAVQQTGGAVNPDVLARQVQADSLPVKVRLSQGQALADERLISLELNARGKHEIYSKGFAEQNKALVENLRVMRDETGPDVFSTNAVEHADKIIDRYKQIDEAARTEISAKYKALEDANGGQLPVNGRAFVGAADAALAKKMKGRYLPSQIRGDIEEFRDNAGFMSFEQFENLRTNLATEARKAERSGDGNAAAAINIVRRELESLPMEGESAKLKALANDARAAAKARFDALDADPAYKAAVNDSVTPDSFVQKFIVNGARDNVAKLSEAMAGDATSAQTLKVATLEHLRKSAGIDSGYNGNFTQAGYNKALQALEPKLGFLLDAKTAETARNLGDVARYTQFQPKGSFANNSNTFVSAAAEKAADALEGIIDFKTGGLPIASTVRKQLNENKVRKQAEETFAPGAGLTKLSDLSKVEKKKP